MTFRRYRTLSCSTADAKNCFSIPAVASAHALVANVASAFAAVGLHPSTAAAGDRRRHKITVCSKYTRELKNVNMSRSVGAACQHFPNFRKTKV